MTLQSTVLPPRTELADQCKNRCIEDEVVVFLHIPKTAGTSVRRLLEMNFSPEDRLDLYGVYGHKTLLPEDFLQQELAKLTERPKLIVGHISFELIERMPWPVRTITFLRDPLQVALSRWKHWHRSHKPAFKLHLNKYRDLDDYLETFKPNAMSRRLGLSANFMRYHRRAAFKVAQTRIREKFAFVGLVERFEQDTQCLVEVLKLPKYQVFHENSGESSGNVLNDEDFGASKAAIRTFKVRNRLDYQVYRWVESGCKNGIFSHHYARGKSLAQGFLSRVSGLVRRA